MTKRNLCLALTVALLCLSLSAQEVTLCSGDQTPCAGVRPVPCTSRDTKPCPPPARLRHIGIMVPYDGWMKFGRAIPAANGSIDWVWLKAGEPSRRCTDAERKIAEHVAEACDAKVGDVMLVTTAFRLEAVKKPRTESTRVRMAKE